MKKVIFAILCGALLIGAGSPAKANDMMMESDTNGVYAGVKFIDSYQTMWPSIGNQRYYHSQNTVGGAVFAGYDFYPQYNVPIRTEIEYAIRSNVNFEDSLSIGGYTAKAEANWGLQTVLLNVYTDWHNSTNFIPYIGLGVGAGISTTEYKATLSDGFQEIGSSKSTTNAVLAGQFGLGTAYAFNENVAADLGYRMLFTSENDTKFHGVTFSTLGSAHEVSLGLRFSF